MNNITTSSEKRLDVIWHNVNPNTISNIKAMLENHMYNERSRSIIVLYRTYGDRAYKVMNSQGLTFNLEPSDDGYGQALFSGDGQIVEIAFVGRP